MIIFWKIRVTGAEYLNGQFSFGTQKRFSDEQILIRDLVLLALSISEKINTHTEKSAQQNQVATSCKKGCDACCHYPVPISIPEVLYLGQLAFSNAQGEGALEAQPKNIDFVGFRSQKSTLFFNKQSELMQNGFDLTSLLSNAKDLFKARHACIWLENKQCSVHANRPLVCREHLAISQAKVCEEGPGSSQDYLRLPILVSQVLSDTVSEVTGIGAEWWPLVLLPQAYEQYQEFSELLYSAKLFFNAFLRRLNGSCSIIYESISHEAIDHATLFKS